MEERLRFVARRLEGESMTALCREFGTSRKTGHKLRKTGHKLRKTGHKLFVC
jgi:transposase-like protein